MISKQQHIIFKVFTLCLVLSLLFPAATKFVHLFEHHNHEVCKDGDTTHIHQVDLDCEFQKFSLHTHIFISDTSAYWTAVKRPSKVSITTYKTLKHHKPLSYSLRGPPVLA
ncbi:hypothetical protein KO493_15385 [Tamlana agarivorans]|uniref:Uncharacterized protein n=1 Tax=Pseudotamlana agarivorans TaxID=481183 RepID=A0ACC5UCM7_9FLAO|nr:hypothetical protein [Tamlana agarivorans]MBU2952082.1 hypothetical protein [Tamlana agarivorans]